MAGPYELRPILLGNNPHPVATIVQTSAAESRRLFKDDPQPPSPSRPSDEWMSDTVWVVDEKSQQDVLEVQLNLSFIERAMGRPSALTARDTKRLTVAAFNMAGATAVHRLLRDTSLARLGYRPEWPWEAALRRRREQEAMFKEALLTDALLSVRSEDTSTAFRSLFLLVLLVGLVAGIAFRQTTVGVAYAMH